ncbi:hypothetical protein Bbelb_155140 [Branchiostoma belcheri]|nr:hypothetical protein Bbelb_155140 [Branchiostoma belcheri]
MPRFPWPFWASVPRKGGTQWGSRGVNVALGKTAYQTSTHWPGAASRAVDGNTDSNWLAGTCTHTANAGETDPSWWVDLGQSYMIARVVIFNRLDCCPERLNPFNIHIGDSYQVSMNPKCGGDHHIALNQPSISVSCPGMMGRYVGVRLPGHYRVLTLCEVQVYTETDSPQFLTCSAATYTSLYIRWVKPRAPLIGYRVNYIIVNDSPSDVISTDFGPENEEQVLLHVLADQEYSITLVAVGMYEESLPVEVTCATMTPPPEDFRVKDVTETSITVSWIHRTDSLAISYRMWIGRSDTAGSLFTQFVPTNQTDLTCMDLSPGTEYVVSGTSINTYNEGPAMDVTVVTTVGMRAETPLPVSPSLHGYSRMTSQDGHNRTDADYDHLDEQRRVKERTFSPHLRQTSLASYIKMSSNRDKKTMTASMLFSVTQKLTLAGKTVQITDETDSPQFLTCSAATYTSLSISWVKPRAPLIGYRVNYTSVSDSPADVYLTDAGPDDEEQVLLHVLADREYSVTLVAVGMYEKSLPVGVTCGTMTPPPEDLRVKDITETSITVSWIQRTNSLAIGHRMWIGWSDTAESLFTQFVPTGQTDLTFSDLSPATEYVISATSINRHNEGPAVNIAVVTKTPSPTALYVEQKTANTVTISWSPPQSVITAYNITFTGNGRSTSVMEPGDVDSCKLTGLVPGSQYDIDLVAVSWFGRSLAVSTIVITDTDPPSRLNVTKSSTTWLFLEWTSPVANILSFDLEISDEFGRTTSKLTQSPTPFALDEDAITTGEWTTTNYMTSPGRSTEPPRISQTSTPDMNKYTTSPQRTTEDPGKKLEKLVQDLDQNLPVKMEAEDILALTSNIKDIIKPADVDESEMPPSVLLSLRAEGSRGRGASYIATAFIIVEILSPRIPTSGFEANAHYSLQNIGPHETLAKSTTTNMFI